MGEPAVPEAAIAAADQAMMDEAMAALSYRDPDQPRGGKGKEKKTVRFKAAKSKTVSDAELIDTATKTAKLQEMHYQQQKRDLAKQAVEEKRAAKAAERLTRVRLQAERKAALPPDTSETDRMARIVSKVRRYQRMAAELGCVGSGKGNRINTTSNEEDIDRELMLQEQQANEARGTGVLTNFVDVVVQVLEQGIAQKVNPAVFDAHDAHFHWKKKVQSDQALQHVLKHLEIKYTSWFAASPELALAMSIAEHFKTVNQHNQQEAGAARSAQRRTQEAPQRANDARFNDL